MLALTEEIEYISRSLTVKPSRDAHVVARTGVVKWIFRALGVTFSFGVGRLAGTHLVV